MAKLRAAGINVDAGVLEDEVLASDPAYFHHRTTGLPRVTLKMAATLDGQAGASDRTSQWITSEAARADAHRLRSEHDAVAVGSGTVLADNPALTVRLPGYEGPQPLRVVVAGTRPLPPDAAVLQGPHRLFMAQGGEGVDLVAMLKELGSDGVLSLLVEGGPTLAGSVLASGLVNEIVLYLGAKIARGVGQPVVAGTFETISDALDVQITDVTMLGTDVRITATPNGSRV
jgi:diaminohydroxyphosphoribosylaminopyrimidine deaminase/5-amino-6-(5-phosphoribosylamino)uracil reductase